MQYLEDTARNFMQFDNGSYSRLADHLNKLAPRPDSSRWTKDSAYHFCRTHGIKSKRPCKNQPAVGCAQRTKTRRSIVSATLEALSLLGKTIHDIAPVQFKTVVSVSGSPASNVRNNWNEIEDELNSLAGIPAKLRFIED